MKQLLYTQLVIGSNPISPINKKTWKKNGFLFITWNITYLRKYSTCESHSDIVYDIGWVCSGLNTTGVLTSFDFKGSTGISTTGLTDPIPYSSLTEGDVIEWIRNNAYN